MALMPIILRGMANLSIRSKYPTISTQIKAFAARPQFYSNSAAFNQSTIDSNKEPIITKDVISKINSQVQTRQEGRLFAVVHVAGKQHRVTEGDVVIVEGYWPPDVGDQIKLDKVLMVGALDFSLFGRPVIQKGLVDVFATVIEKGLSHTKTHFKKKRRKQYMRINFIRVPHTTLRINKVAINGLLNKPADVSGLEHSIL